MFKFYKFDGFKFEKFRMVFPDIVNGTIFPNRDNFEASKSVVRFFFHLPSDFITGCSNYCETQGRICDRCLLDPPVTSRAAFPLIQSEQS